MQPLIAAAPIITDHLCAACAEHFAGVRAHLDAHGRRRTGWNPRLVRGLDYYTRTTFEFFPAGQDGQQDALGGGGRYDGLIELLGGRPTPGIGFGLGLDRVVLALARGRACRPPTPAHVSTVVVGADPADTVTRLRIATELRAAGLSARAELGQRKLGKQLESAGREGAHLAVICGDELAARPGAGARPPGRHPASGGARGAGPGGGPQRGAAPPRGRGSVTRRTDDAAPSDAAPTGRCDADLELDAGDLGPVRGRVRRSRATSRPRHGPPSSAATAGPPLRVAADGPGGPVGGQLLVTRPRGLPWGMGYLPRGPVAIGDAGRRRRSMRSRGGCGTSPRVPRLGWVRMEPEAADTPGAAGGARGSRLGARATRAAGTHPHHRPRPRTRRRSWPACTASAASPSPSRSGWGSGWSSRARSAWASSMPSTPTRCGGRASRLAPRRPTGTCGGSWRRGAWRGCCSPRTARPGAALATLFLVSCGPRVVDLYGGTTAEGGRLRANYLLKWEAIRRSPRRRVPAVRPVGPAARRHRPVQVRLRRRRGRLRRRLGPGHRPDRATGCCGWARSAGSGIAAGDTATCTGRTRPDAGDE